MSAEYEVEKVSLSEWWIFWSQLIACALAFHAHTHTCSLISCLAMMRGYDQQCRGKEDETQGTGDPTLCTL